MNFDDWMDRHGSKPRAKGPFDDFAARKGVTEKPAAAPAPRVAPESHRTVPRGTNTTHREGSFPQIQGSLDFE